MSVRGAIERLSIGSLFSGIGGLERGLELAGLGPMKWQAESEPFCRRVLARHWPDARRFEDVRDVDQEAGRVDIACGGFPCQDVSVAGSGRGLDGERSRLWTELVRVARVVGPRYLVVENVAALTRRGMGTLLSALAESGFDAAWDCIPAAAIGAPHRRDRLFLVAWRVPDAIGDSVRERAERGAGSSRSTDAWNTEPQYVGAASCAPLADTTSGTQQGTSRSALSEQCATKRSGLAGDVDHCRVERGEVIEATRRAGNLLSDPARWRIEIDRIAARARRGPLPLWPPPSDDVDSWANVPSASQPALCGVVDGISAGVDAAMRRRRLRALGNAVVPAVAEVVGCLIRAAEQERTRVLDELATTAEARAQT